MERTIIRLCYRKIIDATAQKPWDKLVFDASYSEFLMQFQLYNQQNKYTDFSTVVQQVTGADKLHFLVSTAVTGYLKQLNEKVPDVLNNAGKTFLTFKHFRFEIINSNTRDKSKHQVAVNFYSEPLLWYTTVGSQLIVAPVTEAANMEAEMLTEQFSLQPFLSIYSIKTMSS
ncbi:hypothetical protein I5907_06250 [Panacibacter sp. DH6]|uniref:Uncharacterized protein n=1 Tax=Panacibacter microcysteis TaxID=2793269 RepID=A0A931E2E5_9BACT|nr:hypothetical protein [Panacibacter microcysteis]MBG9375828.1 hypothetical protein [Panacibacter microcysteis]